MKFLRIEKVAVVGDIVTLLCCVGFGPVVAALSAIGATFLLQDAILAPVLVAFLALGAIGLYASHRRHGRWRPQALHAGSAVVVFAFTFVAFVQPLIWLGALGLLGAVAWDVVLRRRCESAGAACELPTGG
jgi:mercuric ion transport protein